MSVPPAATPVPARGGVLRGRVYDGAGAPVPHAMLTLVGRDGRQRGRARSHEDGAYELADAAPGAYLLVVSARGHQPRAVDVTLGEQPARHDVTLTPHAGLAGTVRHALTGRPLPDARLTVLNAEGGVVATATTTADGTYTLSGLPPGTYTLVAGGYPAVAAGVTLQARATGNVDLELGHDTR
nr:carboxypeptidase-like regulatory domain-containing protein [Streptomyces brasiliensis]